MVRVRGAMWALFYASVALAIQVSALVRWSWPEETSAGVLATLYEGPKFSTLRILLA